MSDGEQPRCGGGVSVKEKSPCVLFVALVVLGESEPNRWGGPEDGAARPVFSEG